MQRSLSALLLAGLLLFACAPEPSVLPPNVESAWEQYRAEPTASTYLRFINVNRAAAMVHP